MNKAPIFLIGVARSGNTLLSTLLDNHPELFFSPVSRGFPFAHLSNLVMQNLSYRSDCRQSSLVERMLAELCDKKHTAVFARDADAASIEDMGAFLTEQMAAEARQHGKVHFGDKCTDLLDLLPKVSLMFPQSRFIHIIRDGRAVAMSTANRRHVPLKLAIQNWKRLILQGRIDGHFLGPGRYFEVTYERLVSEPETVTGEILQFLDLPFPREMLNLRSHKDTEHKDAYVQGEFVQDKIHAWKKKLSAKQIRELERIAGDVLQDLGYPLQEMPAEGPFEGLSPLRVLWLKQLDAFKNLTRRTQMVMLERRLIPVKQPFFGRIRKFLATTSNLWLGEHLVEQGRKRPKLL